MSDLKTKSGERVILEDDSSPTAIKSNKNVTVGASSESGNIARHIGTGSNAKDSFVWMTLRSCFMIAGLLSAGVFISYFYFVFHNMSTEVDIIANLKDVWAIFTPIITLALGYAFGKRDRK